MQPSQRKHPKITPQQPIGHVLLTVFCLIVLLNPSLNTNHLHLSSSRDNRVPFIPALGGRTPDPAIARVGGDCTQAQEWHKSRREPWPARLPLTASRRCNFNPGRARIDVCVRSVMLATHLKQAGAWPTAEGRSADIISTRVEVDSLHVGSDTYQRFYRFNGSVP